MPAIQTKLKYYATPYPRRPTMPRCNLQIYTPRRGLYVVIYSQPEDDYNGLSVTNGAEYIATAVVNMPFMEEIPPGKILWVEHYPNAIAGETFDLVVFKWIYIPHPTHLWASDPIWHRVDRGWVEQITLESLTSSYPDAPPELCPICNGELRPDVEYMQDKYGLDWHSLPWPDWSFACEECGETGLWEEFVDIAERGYEEIDEW